MSKTLNLKAVFSKTNIDFLKNSKITFYFSTILIILSILLVLFRGLNFGIDFAGGVLMEVRFEEKIDVASFRQVINDDDFGELVIQNFDENTILIKVSADSKREDQIKVVAAIKERIEEVYRFVDYRKVDFVGPQIGSELIVKGIAALILGLSLVMVYIWIRFDWQFGVGAILALIHDVVLTFGFFALTNLEFNLSSIAAILTVIGYSINDSVVIFDRVRENLRKYKKMEIIKLLNLSINSTLSRTVLTAGTTLLALLSLILFGGDVLRSFSCAMFFGVVVGTYSSIYIAAPFLMRFDLKAVKKEELDN